MKNKTIKKKLKKGFISIEIVVIAMVAILGGLAGTSAYLSNGKTAQSKVATMINDTINTIEEDFDFSAVGSDVVIPEEVVEAPGLYRDGVLVASWDSLLEDSFIYLDANGTLTTNYDGEAYNLSSEFLNGKLVLSTDVKVIGGMAFDQCYRLTEVVIPNTVEKIMWAAFEGCRSLTAIDIPESVTSIGSAAFYDTGLTSIHIPKSVTSISEGVFGYKNKITSMTVDPANPVYDSRNNSNAIIITATNTLTAGCLSTTIPNSVTAIGNYAFYMLKDLTSITIPNSVTSIGSSAFYGCSNLDNVYIPASVETMGMYAFSLGSEKNIYCETSSKPSGWDSKWAYQTRTKFGVTYDEYLTLIQ